MLCKWKNWRDSYFSLRFDWFYRTDVL